MTETLPFISTYYNSAGMPIAAKTEDLILFVSPAFKAAVGVEALAAAFNIEYTDIPTRMITIPDEQMKIAGAQAILTTKDFFVVADSRFEMTSAPNPVGLYQNFFLHHWQIVSASRFVPLVLFTSSEPSTVIPEIVTPVTSIAPLTTYDDGGTEILTLTRGRSFGVTGSALTTPDGGANDSIRLELVGALSEFSYLTNSGIGHIGIDEQATSITIRATSLDDNTVTAELVRPVIGDRVILYPNPRVIPDADKDGLLEVTPRTVTKSGSVITIPATEGVSYFIGTNKVSGKVTVSATTTVTATANAGYELATGATASWTFTV
jgi:hypothetical protein